MVFIILASIICFGWTAFGAYQIGYSNGADANYRMMMQEWEMLKTEREKLETERKEKTPLPCCNREAAQPKG